MLGTWLSYPAPPPERFPHVFWVHYYGFWSVRTEQSGPGFLAPFLSPISSCSPCSATDKAQWLTGKQGREVAGCPQRGFHAPGCFQVSLCPVWNPSAALTTDTQWPLFPPYWFFSLHRCIISPLFSELCFRQRERLWWKSAKQRRRVGEPLAIPVWR